MANRDRTPAFLVVQDEAVAPEAIVRVSQPWAPNGDPYNLVIGEQAGPTVQQPRPDDVSLEGDIKPLLSGTPEGETPLDLKVAAAGTTGNLRWGFDWNEQDAFQFRQNPCAVSRFPALLDHDDESVSSGRVFFQSPRAVELTDGRLMVMWMRTPQRPIQKPRSVLTSNITDFFISYWNPETGSWTVRVQAAIAAWQYRGAGITQGPVWTSFDLVTYPDTEEVVALICGNMEVSGGLIYPILLTAHSSDNGETWQTRSTSFFNGSNPVLPSMLDNRALCVAMERTRTGRLAALVTTTDAVMALVSDDRGRTWGGYRENMASFQSTSTYYSSDSTPVQIIPWHPISMHRMRNGTLIAYSSLCARSNNTPAADKQRNFFWTSTDGENWTFEWHGLAGPYSYTATAVVERPNGYPWIFATTHDLYSASSGTANVNHMDEIVQIAVVKQDVIAGDSVDEVFANTAQPGPVTHMHPLLAPGTGGGGRPNNPSGELTEWTGVPVHDGFADIYAIRYRGQVLLITTTDCRDGTGNRGVNVYAVDCFQPLQEKLLPTLVDGTGVVGVNRNLGGTYWGWDCYIPPNQWNWTQVTGGTFSSAIQAPNVDAGYLETSVAGGQNYYNKDFLPQTQTRCDGVCRFVVQPRSGGTSGSDDIALEWRVEDTTDICGLKFTFWVDGNNYMMRVFDSTSFALLATHTITNGALYELWIEVVSSITSAPSSPSPGSPRASRVMVRAYKSDQDPDWLVEYDQVYGGTVNAGNAPSFALEYIRFGHFAASGTGVAWWKRVHFWRPDQQPFDQPLQISPATYIEDDSDVLRMVAGEAQQYNDAGIWNTMRAALGLPFPPQFFAEGYSVSWRGAATLEGSAPVKSGFSYPASGLFDLSTPQRGWRSTQTDQSVEIVLDATLTMGNLGTFNASAIAVIGRNWPKCTIQFNDVDSWVSSVPLEFVLSVPGGGSPIDRTTHLWSIDVSEPSAPTIAVYPFRVTCSTAASRAGTGWVFTPHRYAPQPNGARFFAVFPQQPLTADMTVIPIVDNNEDTLFLETDPTFLGIEFPEQMCIISDRFAWDFKPKMPAAPVGYRFMRILIEDTLNIADDDLRIGTIVLGQATRIETGVEIGNTVGFSAGGDVTTALTGASFANLRHAAPRTFTMDTPAALPEQQGDEVVSPDLAQLKRTWQQVAALALRLQIAGEIAAFAFDGRRFIGDAAENGEQLLTDPYDLALVRAASVGEWSALGAWGRTIPEVGNSGQTECVPFSVNAIRRLVFTEVL